jgi:Flp pilus assembly protein TadB
VFDRAKSPEERRKLKGDQLRVSDADRADAIRRLRAHESMGHLESKEASDRVEAVQASTTPEEIAKLFVELPALTARPPSIERRSSTQDRQDAISLLEKAYSEGRIEAQECAVAKDRVHAARTRSEIDAAFHGLSTPTRAALGEKASSATKQATELSSSALAEGGRRAGKAFRRGVLAVGALMIGIVLVIAGVGVGALVFFLGAVVLFVSAAISLASSTA